MGESEQFCSFLIGEYRCAVPMDHITEVLAPQHLTPVPIAPSTVAGLLNLRGQILTVLDLRASLLGLGAPSSSEPMVLVLERANQLFALLVDAIGDVLRAASGDLLGTPETIPVPFRRLTTAVIRQGDVITLVLDAERIAQAGVPT
ncbi:chemotaxis protein CheW [Ferrimicrobium sp.]|uniref:chemotaxis protein CheW n=1 Tax=Ferrimicrobium sp. TaxID=2926050 RepID=UPI00263A15CF|nr:chemotaxis protein CheW [Ferrimicrobium sp.]